jgi:tetratricopeptide (TPR) repeat protein
LHGARYCALLLELARNDKDLFEVKKRAEAGYETARAGEKIMEMSLNRMMQGLCHAALGHLDLAGEALDAALVDMRSARKIDFMPRVLLARAKLMAVIGNRTRANQDLQEALEIADWCGMDLYRIEAMLLEANLQLDPWRVHRSRQLQSRVPTGDRRTTDPLGDAEDTCDQVSDLIENTDYGLRRAELLLLQARISFYRGDREQALTQLDKARERIGFAGRHGLQRPLETVAEELATANRNLVPRR